MAQPETPIIQQRRLRAELRRAREEMGRTQKEVADALDWSPSKLIRIETGAAIPATSDLMALLQHYGVTDRIRVDELVGVARASRKHAWWDEYRPYVSHQFLTFLGYEASTMRIRAFQGLLIPGLLQTREYAQAIMRTYTNDTEHIALGVDIRTKRQQLLDLKSGPEMFFVLDEAALHRWVGGPDVMRKQLLRLEELDQRPNISIRIVQFSAGSHPGMRGAFSVFEFPFEEEDYAVVLEHPNGEMVIQNNPEVASNYVETFFELEGAASPEGELQKITRPVLDRLSGNVPEPPAAKPVPKPARQ